MGVGRVEEHVPRAERRVPVVLGFEEVMRFVDMRSRGAASNETDGKDRRELQPGPRLRHGWAGGGMGDYFARHAMSVGQGDQFGYGCTATEPLGCSHQMASFCERAKFAEKRTS